MNYQIAVFDIDWVDEFDEIRFKHHIPLGLIQTQTETDVDVELLYILCNTSNSNNVLWQMLKNRENKNYMLVCAKQSPFTGLFKYYGYSIISKRHDAILWDTKHMNLGNLNYYNIQTRDPIEEVRRGNWRKVPGGEDLKKAFKNMGLERISLEKFRQIQQENQKGEQGSNKDTIKIANS